MANQFHEDFQRATNEPGSSNRSFGFVFAAVFLLIGILLPLLHSHPVRWWATALAAVFLCLALLAPRVLAPLNRLWTAFGHLLNRIVSPVVMGLLFIVAVIPTGLALRLSGRDPLRLALDRGATTYWQVREPAPPTASFTQQF